MKLLKLFLVVGGMAIGLASCKSFEMGREMHRSIPLVEKDYDIVGTVRVEGKVGKKGPTYDGLLKEARSKYGADVDVVGMKIDKMQRGDTPFLIVNAYVVKYR